jgi:two-component system sensor histidine kinase/response regulator
VRFLPYLVLTTLTGLAVMTHGDGSWLSISAVSALTLFGLGALRYQPHHSRSSNDVQAIPSSPPPNIPYNRVSHDIRTPLNGILGAAAILRNAKDRELASDYLEIIFRSSKELGAVVTDLLDTYHGRGSGILLQEAPGDLSELVSLACSIAKISAIQSRQDCIAYISPAIPETALLDSPRVFQLLRRFFACLINDASLHAMTAECTTISTNVSNTHELRIAVQANAGFLRPSILATISADGVISRLLPPLNARVLAEEGTGTLVLCVPYKQNTSVKKRNVSLEGATRLLSVSNSQRIHNHLEAYAEQLGIPSFAGSEDMVLTRAVHPQANDLVVIDMLGESKHIDKIMPYFRSVPHNRLLFLLPCDTSDPAHQTAHRHGALKLHSPFGISDLYRVLDAAAHEFDRERTNRGRGLHVLVVDDVKINQVILAKHLEVAGHYVETASDGGEALARLESSGHFAIEPHPPGVHPFDIIIMDIDMPVMGGLAATEQIRSREESLLRDSNIARHIPIIAATADVVGSDYERFILAGMEWFITKPVDPNRLIQLIDHFGGLVPSTVTTGPGEGDEIDPGWLHSQFDGDRDAIQEILSAFLEEIGELRLDLVEAAAKGEPEEIRARAHAIKGSLQNVGAHAAASIAKEMESLAKAKKGDAAQSLTDTLVSRVQAVEQAAVRLKEQGAASSAAATQAQA